MDGILDGSKLHMQLFQCDDACYEPDSYMLKDLNLLSFLLMSLFLGGRNVRGVVFRKLLVVGIILRT